MGGRGGRLGRTRRGVRPLLAARGLDLVLVARRPGPLAEVAQSLPTRTVPVVADLSTTAGIDAVIAACAERPVGLVVANAAYSPIGSFVQTPAEETLRAVDLNCRALLLLAHHFVPPMV
ncbi:MAG: SDR family oxidoreductase, partial [Micromonosporaceae bacterium]|nr:SDR family oxidoreductase [Micromonosporaceae bacterium]